MTTRKKNFIKKNQVVCGIVIGELDTKESHIHWLSADEYEHFTNINTKEV